MSLTAHALADQERQAPEITQPLDKLAMDGGISAHTAFFCRGTSHNQDCYSCYACEAAEFEIHLEELRPN